MPSGKSGLVLKSTRAMSSGEMSFIQLAGTPAITEPSWEKGFVTTAPMPTMHFPPMAEPGANLTSEPT